MKSMLKLTLAITAGALLGSASVFAGQTYHVPTANEIAPTRFFVTQTSGMCNTMVIDGGGRNGKQVVPCKDYSGIRPDDCRRACAK